MSFVIEAALGVSRVTTASKTGAARDDTDDLLTTLKAEAEKEKQ